MKYIKERIIHFLGGYTKNELAQATIRAHDTGRRYEAQRIKIYFETVYRKHSDEDVKRACELCNELKIKINNTHEQN